jgi:hypothetical protein
MGMFDYFHSSFDLGEEFTNVECHTKDIEEGIGGTMTHYWLDPAGYLYRIDYSHTSDLKIYEPGDPEYNEDYKWLNFEWVPNGNHGKIRPCMITKYVSVYPSRWDGQFEDWPTCKIHFKYGRLVDYDIMTKNEGV